MSQINMIRLTGPQIQPILGPQPRCCGLKKYGKVNVVSQAKRLGQLLALNTGELYEEEGGVQCDRHRETESERSETITRNFSCSNPGDGTNGVGICTEVDVDHGNERTTLDCSVITSSCCPDDSDKEHGDCGECTT